jgi:uncharacterized membrane protein HdeD (DUF308 family)
MQLEISSPISARVDAARASRLLRRIYFIRVALSALWVGAIFTLSSRATQPNSRDLLVGLVLAAYPMLDAACSIVDRRVAPTSALKWLLYCNALAGLAAALAIALRSSDLATELHIFGWWAIASGATQLTAGAVRQRWLRGQWLMIISGAGSVYAGTTFAGLSASSAVGLPILEQYSVGGAAWYLIAGLTLGVSALWRRDATNSSRGQTH